MSYYAQLDNEAKTSRDVATTSGWPDFARAVEGLPLVAVELRHVAAFGWTDDCPVLAADLREAIRSGGLSRDQRDIAAGILEVADDAEVGATLVVTDGVEVSDEN